MIYCNNGTGCVFPRAWHRLHLFPRLPSIACIPALDRLYVSPPLALVACFPALGRACQLGIGCMFSRVLVSFACVPALDSGYLFSRAWHRLHVFPRLVPVASRLSQPWHRLYFSFSQIFYMSNWVCPIAQKNDCLVSIGH